MEPAPAFDPDTASLVEVRSYFVRGRNALLVRGQFGPIFMDYYLHAADHNLRLREELDTRMKEALVGVTLHCASTPWNEAHAWTVNFHEPRANFFVTGDNRTATIAGRCFTENVRVREQQLFYAQVQKAQLPLRQSTIDFEGNGFFSAVEQFYLRSEQRLARFFEHSEEDYVFISAQPQCDLAWLESLTPEDIRTLDRTEQLSLLETRHYRWECGCTMEKLYAALLPHASRDMDGIFHGEEVLHATCPRCARRYYIDREQLEAWVAEREVP
jgi:molecular chaperone Hsp33